MSVIPTEAVYMAMTYNVVSLDAIMVDAMLPIVLSGPCVFKMSVKIARAPPPEIERMKLNGTTSDGTFIAENKGESMDTNNSIAPDALNKLVATTTASIVGNIFKIAEKLSVTPLIKVS